MVPAKLNKEKLKQKQAINNSNNLNLSKKKEKITEKTPSPNISKNIEISDDDEGLKQMVGGCCVCADHTGYANNLLVYCDGCDVAVHQGCYGIINVPEGDWFCRRCEFKQKNDNKSIYNFLYIYG